MCLRIFERVSRRTMTLKEMVKLYEAFPGLLRTMLFAFLRVDGSWPNCRGGGEERRDHGGIGFLSKGIICPSQVLVCLRV